MRAGFLLICLCLWGCTEVTRTEPGVGADRPRQTAPEGREQDTEMVDDEETDTGVGLPADSGGSDSGFPDPTSSVDCMEISRADSEISRI